MADLTLANKRYLEYVLRMSGGDVLDYSYRKFGDLFSRRGIDINSDRYQTSFPTLANKMHTFWELEPDALVGQVLSDALDDYVAMCRLGSRELDPESYEECRRIVARLCGTSSGANSATDEASQDGGFEMPDIQKLPVEPAVYKIIQGRLDEARRCLSVEAYLSAIILCGSVLEAVLLGAAQNEPKKFYSSSSSPKKKDGSVKPLHEWNLMQLIDVASNVGLLKTDARDFSQVLRDFRNYIHPAKQSESNFAPDKHTAKLCLDAFKTALADVAGER